MQGWNKPDVFRKFEVSGRTTMIGLYFNYFRRHIAREMASVADFILR
jgi:hypothetical protein